MKHIVGFSGGIDSQAAARWVLNRFPKEDVILLNTTAGRNESPATTAHIEWYSANVHPVVVLDAKVKDIWLTDGYAETKGLDGEAMLTFGDMIRIKRRPPARKAQFCTEVLKLRPQLRWIRENVIEPFTRYSGVRRHESDPRKDTPYTEWDDFFECPIFHPLMDWTKQMCFDYVMAHGEQVNPLYALGFNRVGCAPCINSGREDIRKWFAREPAMLEKVRRWEQESGCTFFPPMVPGLETNNIDQVIAWANEVPRGRGQLALDVLYTPPVCESKFGLCE